MIELKEEEKAEFIRLRLERYYAMSYESKISALELAYRFSSEDKDFYLKQTHLMRIIELMTEKIKKRHC